ncbi:Mur ligase domain-containing protein [Brucepastera parasyntrophica]|uniref:Mur ligase domain-containing protein n=1 Tax=Brucepastera parasyntrophica TaxID=2880008 RepID=UPI00210C4943|nr:Mur ligase domain-containing protein [Brucepastera parasyntrophica]ULQ60172.1 Mur ligase domain-containing protein [Brucepastera parasyntrophica]
MDNGPGLMTVSRLVDAVRGNCLCDFTEDHSFSSVVTDSRNVKPGSLFVPLIGEKQDGHNYIPQALESGASVILVDSFHARKNLRKITSEGERFHACFIQVDNTLQGLQDAARAYVASFPGLLRIGITGSNGKTTTKEVAAAIFHRNSM